MGYRTSTKLGSAWDTCWRTRRSLGPRYVGVGLLLGIYIASRVLLGALVSIVFLDIRATLQLVQLWLHNVFTTFWFVAQNSPSFAAVTLGCVPMLPPLLSLLRVCVTEQVPDFAAFYLNLLNSSGVPNGHEYIGKGSSANSNIQHASLWNVKIWSGR